MENKSKNKKSYTALMKENRELRKVNKELARIAKNLDNELYFAEWALEVCERKLADIIKDIL